MAKKGDTLIEVTLAVGIFSMIAIAIVSVMNNGVSSSQTALETSLARNEIDAQAEALRFINTSYIAEKDSASRKYQALWQDLTKAAVDLSKLSETAQADLLQYSPTSCSELYHDNSEVHSNAFIINYRNLGTFNESDKKNNLWPFIDAKNHKNIFTPASTYPRLVYQLEENNALNADTSGLTNLYRAEGVYIIAVKDNKTTSVVSENKRVSAFYDFYIRTCWYGSNANEPSTISTIIRLYDPNAIN